MSWGDEQSPDLAPRSSQFRSWLCPYSFRPFTALRGMAGSPWLGRDPLCHHKSFCGLSSPFPVWIVGASPAASLSSLYSDLGLIPFSVDTIKKKNPIFFSYSGFSLFAFIKKRKQKTP